MFCFRLLFVYVLHFLCVWLERHSALLHTPRFFTPCELSGVPPLVWGTQFFHCLPSTPPPPALSPLPLFFSMKQGPATVSLLPENNFLQRPLLFSSWHFFLLVEPSNIRIVLHSALLRLLWFRLLWCRLLWFAVLCHLLLWWHKTTPGWLYHPEGGGFNKGGGFIPQKGWLYPPKGVVLSPLKVGIKLLVVVLRVVLSPTRGWFYARDQRCIWAQMQAHMQQQGIAEVWNPSNCVAVSDFMG